MNSKGPQPRPPLRAWLWAVTFSFCAVWTFFLAAYKFEPPKSQAFYEFNMARIDQFAEASTGRPADGLSVVMLGNSRLKYATLSEAEMVALAKSRGLGEMRFLKLVNNWAIFEDFEELAPGILGTEPDVIMLQIELLGMERAGSAKLLIFREYLKWLSFGSGPWNPGALDQHDLQFATPCSGDQTEEALANRLEHTERWLSYDSQGRSARMARDFILDAAGRGVRVVIVPIPKTQRIEEYRPSVHETVLPVATRLAHADDRVVFWRYAGGFVDDRYCDLIHLNPDGRRAFAGWLLSKLAGGGALTASYQ